MQEMRGAYIKKKNGDQGYVIKYSSHLSIQISKATYVSDTWEGQATGIQSVLAELKKVLWNTCVNLPPMSQNMFSDNQTSSKRRQKTVNGWYCFNAVCFSTLNIFYGMNCLSMAWITARVWSDFGNEYRKNSTYLYNKTGHDYINVELAGYLILIFDIRMAKVQYRISS